MGARTANALLVDDDSASYYVNQQRLEDDGYSVVLARDGSEGLDRARHSPPNVIFIHLVSSGKDSLAFIQALRSDDVCRHIPVVMLSTRPKVGQKGLHAVNRDRW